MEITWLGHSGIKIKGSKTVIIDPFLTGCPAASASPEEITEADVVIVTHYHSDHLGDAFAICKQTGATCVGIHEIAVDAEAEGITAEGMNIGGTIDARGVRVHMVQALHSAEKGNPAGVIIEMDGKKIYHAGDTGLTYDMKLIGEFFKPDLSFIPIGDRYTMGIPSAAKAVEFVQTKKVIPIHYNTFPIVSADPEEFKKKVGDKAEVIILKPGETYNL
ncbi:MAG: metal-dependent hydrolase [Candidatus Aminicenantes bacterium]|nr:metal-dependent hydrolase [Candidatus Aminicenantes bacterium]MDH5705447.1 metal-dependent hydrolase [Candidatus Aminicenantes bacterium]